MTTHYSQADYTYLKSKAASEGRAFDLVLCSDGVMRTKQDRDIFEREERAALPPPAGTEDIAEGWGSPQQEKR